MAGDCAPLEGAGAGAREVLVRWEEGAGRAVVLPCWLRADTMGGRVVEMATGVASGTLLPGFVSTFTCNNKQSPSVGDGVEGTCCKRSI